ncbi:MAG: hypothetical protein ACK4VI_06505 [Alphaproteobacteria bacterium]
MTEKRDTPLGGNNTDMFDGFRLAASQKQPEIVYSDRIEIFTDNPQVMSFRECFAVRALGTGMWDAFEVNGQFDIERPEDRLKGAAVKQIAKNAKFHSVVKWFEEKISSPDLDRFDDRDVREYIVTEGLQPNIREHPDYYKSQAELEREELFRLLNVQEI